MSENVNQVAHAERDGMAAAAIQATRHLVKSRARAYQRRPATLEALHPGLSFAEPVRLIAIAGYLVERESRSPRRWFGFGGEVSLINARAALLLGRTQRRSAAREFAVNKEPRR